MISLESLWDTTPVGKQIFSPIKWLTYLSTPQNARRDQTKIVATFYCRASHSLGQGINLERHNSYGSDFVGFRVAKTFLPENPRNGDQ
jgi:hypothetical protein